MGAGVGYIGCDVEPETIRGNEEMRDALGFSSEKYRVVLSPAEEFDPGAVDFVFSSPPYYDAEEYSQREGQSHVKYASYEGWLSGFLHPVVRTAYKSLPLGGYFALNIVDIRKKGVVYPLESDFLEIAEAEGFELVEVLEMPIAKLNRSKGFEPIFLLRKH